MAEIPVTRIGFTGGNKPSFDPSMVPPDALWETLDLRSDKSGFLRIRRGCKGFNASLGAGSKQGSISAFSGILSAWNKNLYLYSNNGTPTTIANNILGASATDMVEMVLWARSGAPITYLFAGNGLYETDGVDATLTTPYAPQAGEELNLIRKDSDGTQDLFSGPARCKFAILRASLSQRMAAAGDPDSPNSVYLSAPLDATYWPADQIIQLPDDGGKIIGLFNWYNALIILRNKDVWAFFGSDLTDPGAALVIQDSAVGCMDRRTIAAVPNIGVVFLGPDNIYSLQGVSGIENQAKAVPIADDIRPYIIRNLKNKEGVCAVYHDYEYKISFPDVLQPERVFVLSLQNVPGWYLDSGPFTNQFIIHNGELYGSKFGDGKIQKFTDDLYDEDVEILPKIRFRRESLQPGPSSLKKIYIYALAKGRNADQSMFFFGSSFNKQTFNEGDSQTVNVQTGTEQHFKASVVVDGNEVTTLDEKSFTVEKANHLTLSKVEPVRVYEARFKPSLKGQFFQLRIDATTPGEDIAILGYGYDFSPRTRLRGSRRGVL